MKRFLTLSALSFIILIGFSGIDKLFAQNYYITADTLYTMAGDPVIDGVVLVKNGKIERTGKASSIKKPKGYEELSAVVVTPGFIDAHSVVGLAGIYNQDADQDQLETSDPIQPELRAYDAYNAREDLVVFLRNLGITTVHTGHGPGALISGQTMIVKTTGETVDEAVIKPQHMVAMTLGSNLDSDFSKPGTRAKQVAMLRETFVKGQQHLQKTKDERKEKRDLKMEVIADLLEGKLSALVTVHKAQDIMTAIRLSEEFGFDLVLDGAAEAYTLLDEIKEAGVPVVVHPTMIRTYGDATHATLDNAAKLHKAGIPFYFQSGYEGYVPKTRVVTFEAAVAVANGLDRTAALKALTIQAAKFLGLAKSVGSLEKGKDADIVLYNGDPFEYTTNVEKVLINGKIVAEEGI
jgi:imidazolonepropionase-like amidohydrolase